MSFDPIALEERLARLPPQHRTAFAAACAQRQLENYEVFHRDAGWGEPQVLVDALALLWEAVAHPGTADQARLRVLAQRAEAQAPDLQQHGSVWAGFALDAAAAVAYALWSFSDEDAQQAAWAAGGAYESIYHYVSWELDPSPDPTSDEQVHAHPWMREELQRQEEDLRMLEVTEALGPNHLALLRERSESGGLRPVQRALRYLG
jgi:uncharacterized protein YjaG (DUF416 family)